MERYQKINKKAWNNKVEIHKKSEFYALDAFKKGQTSLNKIELDLLANVKEKSILHLQCHFGQDSLSLQRMGARVTGVDISDKSIELAKELAIELKEHARFICSDIYSLTEIHSETYDIVFTSYGTIIWLPDLDAWAKIISDSLKPGGKLIFVDFHPLVWMYDDDFKKIIFSYFNEGEIEEIEEGTYADKEAKLMDQMITWNHSLSEVFMALIGAGLIIEDFQEYDYAPYPFIPAVKKIEDKVYKLEHIEHNVPLVYSLVLKKLI